MTTLRPLLALALLYAMATAAATAQQQPSVTDGLPGADIDLLKWGITQGALALVLIVVLWSYRRDFFRKLETQQASIDVLHEEKRMLAALIKENTGAALSQALATAANTQATQSLATNIDRLERSLKP